MRFPILICLLILAATSTSQTRLRTNVMVVGGGTGGTAAAIQAARSGVDVILLEEGPWLGGMISAAGVSATDGNHQLPSGIWNEFRERIYAVYGGPEKVATGWVSNTQFEPHVADSIFKSMCAAERRLKVMYGLQFLKVLRSGNRIDGAFFVAGTDTTFIAADIVIDATELGDVLASAGEQFDIGMEAGDLTGERVGVKQSNTIVQDLTYVATLKDYGPVADCTVVKPSGYNPAEFDGACLDYYTNPQIKKPASTARQMLDYGKLPNNKYLINWPIKGNDSYLEVIQLSAADRATALEQAKQKTLRFVYFIQSQLGFRQLGLANDEYPTSDRLALMPYYREGRRLRGQVRFTINHISDPYGNGQPLYRTGISVGDYPIDHHHKENRAAPQHLDFYPVPSFNVPMGALIPMTIENLVVAEKGISVSNVVNGTTRLQPCVLLTGQAAGIIAAHSVQVKQKPSAIDVRKIQQMLLDHGAFIMPYLDVQPSSNMFPSIQRIGATGILRGKGIPFKWANQTWFYPDSLVDVQEFRQGWKEFSSVAVRSSASKLTVQEGINIVQAYQRTSGKRSTSSDWRSLWTSWGLADFQPDRFISRAELAVLLDKTIDPFARPVSIEGRFANKKGGSTTRRQ